MHVATAHAQTAWTGGTADYNTPSDWAGGVVPGPGVNATVDNGGTVLIQPGDPTWSLTDLRSGNATGSGTYIQTGSTANLAGWLRMGIAGGTTGLYNFSAGTIACNGQLNLGESGTGVYLQSGGTATFTGQSWLSDNTGGTGTLALSGGSLAIGSWLAVGRNGGTGRLNVSGGVLNYTATGNSSHIDLGAGGGAAPVSGVVNQTGGTINSTADAVWVGEIGPATYNMTGGTLNALTVNIDVAGTTGVFNLGSGGLVVTNEVFRGSTAGTGTLNFNGGTLQASSGATTPFLSANLSSVNILAGGATINSSGLNIVLAAPLLTGTAAGTADGGVTLTGGGTVTMLNNSTFTGPANLTAGTNLQLGNASSGGSLLGGGTLNLGTSNLTVASPAGTGNVVAGPIAGSGAINVNTGLLQLGSSASPFTGSISVANGGGVILGTGGTTGALPAGANLTIAPGGIFGYNLSTPVNFTGNIPGGGMILEQAGPSVLTLSAPNDVVSLNGANGTIFVNDTSALTTVTGISLNYPVPLAVPLQLETQAILNLITPTSGGTFALTASTSNNLDFSTDTNVRLGAYPSGATVTYSGTINPGATFAASSTTTVVSNTIVLGGGGGTLVFASPIADGGTTTATGVANTAPTSIDINGGTVSLTNPGNTFSGVVTVQPNGVLLLPTGTSAGIFGDAASIQLRSGVIMYPAGDASPIDITTQTRSTTSGSGAAGSTIPAYMAGTSGGVTINTNGNNVTFAGPIGGAPANASSTVLTSAGPFTLLGGGSLTDTSTITATQFFVRAGTMLVSGPTSAVTLNSYSSIGQNAGDSGTLTLNNGATFTTPSDLNVGDNSGTSTATVDSGIINVQNSAFVAGTSTSTTTVTSNTLYVGKGFGGAPFASGVVNQGPGTSVAIAQTFQIGQYGTGVYNQTGGAVSEGANYYLSIGRYSTGVGTYLMSGGTLNIASGGGLIVAEGGTGTMTISGSSVINTPWFYIAHGTGNTVTTGTATLNGGTVTASSGVRFGSNATSSSTNTVTGVLNLNGGVLNTPGISQNQVAVVSGTVNFNGTQIVATANAPTFVTGLTNANVMAGGAVFNTSSFTATIGQSFTSGTAAGTPDGGLTKLGSGVLNLTSTQAYTGVTNISGGTLRLQGLTPIQAGLVAWYDPNDTSSIVTSGANVTAVLNKGTDGNALNAYASNTAAEATISTGTLGLGSGTTTYLALNNTSSYNSTFNDPISGNSARTLFVVGSRGTGASAFLFNQGTLAANQAYGVSDETSNTYAYTFANDVQLGVQSANVPIIVDSTLSNSGTSLNADLILPTSGPAVNNFGGTVAANTTASAVQILGRTGGNSTGTFQEVLEYNYAMTSAQIAQTEAYLEAEQFGYNSSYNSLIGYNSNLLPTTTVVNMTNAGSTLDLNGTNQQIAGLTGTAGTFVTTESGTLTVANTVPNVYGGIITTTAGGGLTVNGGSTLTISSASSTTIQVQSLGTLNIGAGSTLAALASSTHAGRTLIQAASLSVSPTGSLDLGNGDLDLNSSSTSLSAVTQLVATGYNLAGGAKWNGVGGITSSSAAANTSHLTALGVIQNNQNGTPLFGLDSPNQTQFDGTNPGDSDILVKYTYFGDANLDGKVDGSDYSLIDAGYASGGSLTGWLNGDFNYDGVIDGSDYTLIDNAFNNQGSQLTTPTSLVAAVTDQVAASAVPEPASLGLLAFGAAGLVARRRRQV